jgi:hypothetical protein
MFRTGIAPHFQRLAKIHLSCWQSKYLDGPTPWLRPIWKSFHQHNSPDSLWLFVLRLTLTSTWKVMIGVITKDRKLFFFQSAKEQFVAYLCFNFAVAGDFFYPNCVLTSCQSNVSRFVPFILLWITIFNWSLDCLNKTKIN